MENKLKQQLRERMLGQLSSEKTEVDINNAYEVAVEFARYHVEQALKSASDNASVKMKEGMEFYYEDYVEGVDKDSILNSYPSENIK